MYTAFKTKRQKASPKTGSSAKYHLGATFEDMSENATGGIPNALTLDHLAVWIDSKVPAVFEITAQK